MLYSQDRKFVFVAVPKTGTTAIQECLRRVDPDILRNQVHDASGQLVTVPTHATAGEIRRIMGPRADAFTFVAFLRDPRDVVVSKYNFYRTGRAAREQGLAPSRPGDIRYFRFGRLLRVLFAQALPLRLWARLYPYTSSAQFVTDDAGRLLVDRLGRMEFLQQDVNRIFGAFGYTPDQLQLGISNRTEYDRSTARDPRLDAIVARRLPQDWALLARAECGAD